jgi:hypothetical protein
MHCFKVTYKGSWLGGRAIVIANDEQEARDLVSAHRGTVEFKQVEVEDYGEVTQGSVLYNWNGDY